jgi:hypothetical protein
MAHTNSSCDGKNSIIFHDDGHGLWQGFPNYDPRTVLGVID